MREELSDLALEMEKSILFANGFDAALIGYIDVEDEWLTSVYDVDQMIGVLIEEGMSEEESIEYLEFNVLQAFVGPGTPVYVHKT